MLTQDLEINSVKEIDNCIARAMSKVRVEKEMKLIRFIPQGDGFLHHLAFKKLKRTNPTELQNLIQTHILDNENPAMIPAKPRSTSRTKSKSGVMLKRSEINQLLTVLRKAGSQIEGVDQMIEILSPHQTLAQVQKHMIEMVKSKVIDQDLWQTYVRLVQEQTAAEIIQ